MRIDKNTTIRLGDRNIVKIKIGDVVIWQKEPDYLYIQNTYSGSNTITLTTKQSGTPASGTYATSVECSKDKLTWNTLSLTPGVTNTISLNQGEKIYFRNDSGYFNYTDDSNNYYTTITGSKSHKLGGNINTLINYTDLSNVSLSQGCFNRMFLSDIELVDASDLKLPSTTLKPHCYRALLNDCQSLLYAPALPATTLANKCYYAMFYGDYSLISAPELPATNLANACYESIFRSCTSLTSVTIYATSTVANAFEGWLNNVAASGTVYNNGSISLPKNSPSGIPTGWTEVKPTWSWNVVTDGTYPFELNSNGYYESTNKGQSSSYSYATLNYSGFNELVLECINSGEPSWDYGIISQPDVELSKSYENDGETGGPIVFHTFRVEHSTNPVQITIPSDGGSHFITIKYKKDGGVDNGNDSFQFKVIEP